MKVPSSKHFSISQMKTHSGAKKRFGVTGSGAFTRGHAFRRHLMITKTRGQVNRLGEVSPVHKADVRIIASLPAASRLSPLPIQLQRKTVARMLVRSAVAK